MPGIEPGQFRKLIVAFVICANLPRLRFRFISRVVDPWSGRGSQSARITATSPDLEVGYSTPQPVSRRGDFGELGSKTSTLLTPCFEAIGRASHTLARTSVPGVCASRVMQTLHPELLTLPLSSSVADPRFHAGSLGGVARRARLSRSVWARFGFTLPETHESEGLVSDEAGRLTLP